MTYRGKKLFFPFLLIASVVGTFIFGLPNSADAVAGPGNFLTGVPGSFANIKVVLTNFSNTNYEPWTLDQARTMFETGAESLTSFFREVSFEKMPVKVQVLGWYKMTSAQSCTASAASEAITLAQSDPAYTNDHGATVFVILAPYGPGSCGWSAQYTRGSNVVYASSFVNDPRTTITHELGHYLGFNHSGFMKCESGSFDDSACGGNNYYEYGDPYDRMGASSVMSHYGAIFKNFVGWFSESNVVDVALEGDFTIEPLESVGTNPKLLRVWRSETEAITVEYRRPVGFDAKLPASFPAALSLDGAILHVARTPANAPVLFDPTPPADVYAAVLGIGQTWTDSISGTVFTVKSLDANSLTIHIKPNTGTPTQNLPVITSISPPSGPVGTKITINGSEFTETGNRVHFGKGGKDGVASSNNGTTLLFTVPSSVSYCDFWTSTYSCTQPVYIVTPGAYDVSVENTNGRSATTTFVVTLPSTKFSIGDRIQTTANLNVRSTPSLLGTLLGTKPANSFGTVIEGPVYAEGYSWWNINYDSDPDGWSVEDYLELIPPPPPSSDTQSPSIPSDLRAVSASFTSIGLAWAPSTDNVGVIGYRIYRDGMLVATVWVLPVYVDVGLTPVTTYSYAVSAFDAASNVSSQSLPISATTASATENNPPVVSDITVSVPDADPTTPAHEVFEGKTVLYGSVAYDPDGDPVTWSWYYKLGSLKVPFFSGEGPVQYAAFTYPAGSAGKTYIWILEVSDGSMSVEKSITIVVLPASSDTEPPRIYFLYPRANQLVGSTTPFYAYASDNSKIAGIQFYVDGQEAGERDVLAPYSTNFDTRTILDGNHVVTATAWDLAGNASTSPPRTIIVDNASPVISSVLVTTITQTRATITWKTDEPSVGQIEYGETAAYGNAVSIGSFVTDHARLIHNLLPGTTYHFRIKSTDRAKNVKISDDFVFTTLSDTTAPKVTVTSPRENSTVSGLTRITVSARDDIKIAGVRLYVDGAPFGEEDVRSPFTFEWDTTAVAEGAHSLYVVARDYGGNASTSPVRHVAVDNTAPVISGVSAENITATEATIIWTTTEESRSAVRYGITDAYGYSKYGYGYSTEHRVTISRILPGTVYHYRVESVDRFGNLAVSQDYTFMTAPDTTPPEVSIRYPAENSSIGGKTTVFAIASDDAKIESVSFTVDSAPLGEKDTTPAYWLSWQTTDYADGEHTLSATAYDTAGNFSASSPRKVIVDNTAPVISGVSAENITATEAVITWVTDEASSAIVQYGFAEGSYSYRRYGAPSLIQHSVKLTNLTPATTYHYRVQSQDATRNISYSRDYVLTTQP